MTVEIDFVPFATGDGANVETQAEYLADPALATGFQVGIANPQSANKALRQGTFIAAGLATFVSNVLEASILDDGNLTEWVDNLTEALSQFISSVATNQEYADDTGAANAYVIAPDPAVGAYTEGLKVRWKAANSSTGASTLAVSGLPAKNLTHVDGTALGLDSILVGGEYECTYDGAKFQLLDRPVNVVNTELAQMGASTVKANLSGASAYPSDTALSALLTALQGEGAVTFSGSFSTPGTIQIGPLIINVGSYTAPSGGSPVSVTFNTTFPNAAWFPIISVSNAAAGQLGYQSLISASMEILTATEDASTRSGLYLVLGH